MLYRFNNNLINVTEISSVSSTKGSNRDYPYDLTVRMKDGTSIGVCYRTEEARQNEVWKIEQAFRSTVPDPISRYEMDILLHKYTEKIRSRLRVIENMLKGSVENG